MSSRCLILFIFAALLVGLVSCKNNDNVFAPANLTGITVVNAGNDTLNFYVNGTRQNNTSNLFPGGSLINFPVPAGAQNYQFKRFSSQLISFDEPLTLLKNKFNSLYITGSAIENNFVVKSDSLIYDTLANKATIRFVHSSPQIGSLDVFVGDSVSFRAAVFKQSLPFQVFTTGSKEVKIYQTGSSAPLVDTAITFSANRVYTLFSRGSLNGTGKKAFNVGVVQNL